jgi:trk system potassium uptake protein TrkA
VHALVIGCGRVGSAVSQRLAAQAWSVSVVDEDVAAFDRLEEGFSGQTFQGHALDQDVMRAAGVEGADACVVATNGDNTNLLVAQIIDRKFAVPYVVVRVLDPVRAGLYASLGLNVVCPTAGAIDSLTGAVLGQTETVGG